MALVASYWGSNKTEVLKRVPIALDIIKRDHIQKVALDTSDTQVLVKMLELVYRLFNYDEQTAREEMGVNYFSPLHRINAFSKKIIKNSKGAIVNIISIGGLYFSYAHYLFEF